MTPPLHPVAFDALLRRITRPGRYCSRVANGYGMGYDFRDAPHPGNHGVTPHQYGS